MATDSLTGRRRVRSDVLLQRECDRARAIGWPQYEARMTAVAQAREAVRAGEYGARHALRQALVDLAAACERLAEPMYAPQVNLGR